MFGYILPEKPELKIREYELFKAFYCGVCKSIGKRYGQIARLTLNYDSTFLALLLSSLSNGKLCTRSEGCIAHPFKKRIVIKQSGIIDYASDMNIILAYYNLNDNWKDEHSIISGGGMLMLKSGYKKLRKKYGEKCDIIEKKLNELTELEKEKCNSMDIAAEPFARLMEEVTAYAPICSDGRNGEAIRWIGYNLGKWIYILDAYDDIADNVKNKTYNPLICQFGYNKKDGIDELKSRIRERVEFNLTYSLSQIASAYKLLEVKSYSSIIENIIYMGMLRKTENILKIGSCIKVEESV